MSDTNTNNNQGEHTKAWTEGEMQRLAEFNELGFEPYVLHDILDCLPICGGCCGRNNDGSRNDNCDMESEEGGLRCVVQALALIKKYEKYRNAEKKGLLLIIPESLTVGTDTMDEFLSTYANVIDLLNEYVKGASEGRTLRYAPGDTVYDQLGNPWVVNVAEARLLNGKIAQLYRCGHEGTDDYCALWESEIIETP